ncbi:alpha/beta hydrolase [Pseudomonas cannabina]|uniref:Lipase n=3 Tax=Pseudomonas syringae group TaxID=136849 RepID=A0A3M3QFJ9_PSECA|nr:MULTISPECIES: alpha/beta hydrolase [Pseudomonas syringae group]KPB76982.1 Lipase [Pseudomonas syringae pv. maculicola]KPW21057.1 putative lipase/esterase [Pseudomonas cannabina pv. alisalensis]MBM0138970.1 alpha/beta hydrolase [Pseudomonas cannabina pv. alisalensis]QHE96271.1 alpha/beta hydrolase fold domain-containing protein [Pseudomonas syringae pv. maculicola str. ES4326]QQN20669.1 alpha/beta hydrolase [Pseudomonas cannabina pv. alisalensis]
MDANELLDPAYRSFLDEPATRWTHQTLPEIRTRVSSTWKTAATARREEHWTTGEQAHGIRLCLYRPELPLDSAHLPAVLYIHGGGFVLGSPEMADDYLAALANELNALIVAVDYRLAPEHPFPIPLEDCYAALEWIFHTGRTLGMDTRNVVIMGHSAGGGLAAAVAILARNQGAHKVAGLVLIYPMLDHRTGSTDSPPPNPTTGTFSWSRQANHFCWECLRGCYALDDDRRALFSPALATDLSGLPPAFICVGALDLFLEEDLAFGLTLSRSGVPVEMHVYPGVPHMFDQLTGWQSGHAAQNVLNAVCRMIASRTD